MAGNRVVNLCKKRGLIKYSINKLSRLVDNLQTIDHFIEYYQFAQLTVVILFRKAGR
jgi:hypothetical protein